MLFLYKLVPGVAHRSFGLNVARLAELPGSVLQLAASQVRRNLWWYSYCLVAIASAPKPADSYG